jgi:hypothetical protein
MSRIPGKAFRNTSLVAAAALLLTPFAANAQSASGGDRWLHVHVVSTDSDGETVSVNVPLELAEKVLPAINKHELHDGKVTIDRFDTDGVDFRAILEAVKGAKDGEFVTVTGKDHEDVRVAKKDGFLLVHVTDASGHGGHHHHIVLKDGDKDSDNKGEKDAEKHSDAKETKSASVTHVEVKIPMSVVDAMLGSGKNELDIVAGLHMLAKQGDTELVSVKDEENTVRIWVDSKNGQGSEGGAR